MIEKSLTERMSNTGMRGFKRCYPVLAFGASVGGAPALGPTSRSARWHLYRYPSASAGEKLGSSFEK
jgi:hypothetical protein